MTKNIDYSLYLVTNRFDMNMDKFLEVIEESIKGGVTLVQLREKELSTLEFYKLALKVKKITNKYNVPLIINDRLDIAQAVDAEGVHLGQDDMPCDVARKILGEDKIIGISADNLIDCETAVNNDADYIGIGSMYKTNTKDDVELVNHNELKKIFNKIDIAKVAIGGIKESNYKEVMNEYDFDGIAVVSAIMLANDPKSTSIKFLK
ncbi:MAG: thiamine phosphate synthase [Methanobacteriaceae archaeon]|nr:thiamine phosphate synthase [Methanobacteriaceae archaeon]